MQPFLKRAIDATAAALLLLALWPFLLGLAVAVRLALGGPVLFRQRRIGRHEQPFDLLKFRTMTSARDATGALLPDAARLTRFGRFLRSTSLDELPELWNILSGNMSLVGPRPLLPEYLPFYRESECLRHRVRPGITGLAQVSGRNALGWDARLALDAEYAAAPVSLRRDLSILCRTVAIVLTRHGISAEGQATMQRLDEARQKL